MIEDKLLSLREHYLKLRNIDFENVEKIKKLYGYFSIFNFYKD